MAVWSYNKVHRSLYVKFEKVETSYRITIEKKIEDNYNDRTLFCKCGYFFDEPLVTSFNRFGCFKLAVKFTNLSVVTISVNYEVNNSIDFESLALRLGVNKLDLKHTLVWCINSLIGKDTYICIDKIESDIEDDDSSNNIFDPNAPIGHVVKAVYDMNPISVLEFNKEYRG